jgi:hypothetical protein
MSQFRRVILWTALIAIILLIGLSIYGAFLGAERAQSLFNTLPLAVYWFALIALLAAGIVLFRRLLQTPALLLLHVGSICVLLGALWSSNGGHTLAQRLFGIDKIPQGLMGLVEETQENRVVFADREEFRELPFFVRLKQFRLDYYQPGFLLLQNSSGQNWRLPAEAGRTVSLGEDLGTVTIQRVFENFKIDVQGDQPIAYDEPGGSNPALEVTLEKPGAAPGRRYVFEPSRGHADPNNPLQMRYQRMIRDYISELEIVQDGQVVAAKDIEVNHPLHYGGYHFYQHSYGEDRLGVYTVLMVVSDSGLNLVYSGYAMLIVGVFWHFWGQRIVAALRRRQTTVSEVVVRQAQ